MAVNKKVISDMVSGMEIVGNEEGLIAMFGVYLGMVFTDYLNEVVFRFQEEVRKVAGDSVSGAVELLIKQSGYVCGYESLGYILKSPEWKMLVEPMIAGVNDKVEALIGFLSLLGLGRVEAIEVVPNEKLIVRAHHLYEASGYLKRYGQGNKSICYTLLGAVAAAADLIFEEETSGFLENSKFQAEETKCRAKGDPYCEFLVNRKKAV